ncbi:hypothetical protein RI129_004591 [Pyrocoelia pectoralis]|uniref:THAP-type domain-containing protein n=1 Tax=Pyrocoelia pectoralis TaxID=417401 RepID=A0AAN7ZJH2_9COLE
MASKRADLLGKSPEQLYNNFKLCALHFDNKQFTNPVKRNRLLPTAVPKIFKTLESYSSSFKSASNIKRKAIHSEEGPSKKIRLSSGTEMEVEEISCYNWDDKLKLSNEEFGKLLTSSQYNASISMEAAFPSDYLLAHFSSLAYDDIPSALPKDWILLTTARNKSKSNGYFGVAFWNPIVSHIVVAHRGTKLQNMGALFSDVKLASNSIKTNQSESAATFVYLVGLQIDLFVIDGGSRIELSITGHSLGAWLAQMSTFTLKYFKRSGNEFVGNENFSSSIHPHTVTFESPGCRENLQYLRERFVPTYVHTNFGNFFTLDMTVYLSAVNPINSINKHVGVIYMTSAKSHSLQSILDQFDSITNNITKERVLHFESGVKGALKSIFKTMFNNPNRSVIKIPVKEDECSLNVFNDAELDFAKYWNYLSKYDSELIQKIKRRMPYFKIDLEKHLIKSGNLNKTIANIKNLNPSKQFIYELLESVKGINLSEEILEIHKFIFQKVNFLEGYFFIDKYGVKDFLNSSSKLLQIYVSSSLNFQYQLETYILHNVCKYYESTDFFKPHHYTFTNLTFLPTILRGKMFNNTDLKLLVIECYDSTDDNFADIKKLSAQATYKIIVLSMFSFSANIDNSPDIFVNGFGHCIKYEDLQENGQERLLTKNIFSRNEEKMSIRDLLGKDLLLHDKMSLMNDLLPSNLLLRLLEESLSEHIVLDSPYNNILNGFTIELHREVDIKNTVLRHNKKFLFLITNDEGCETSLMNELNVPFKISSNVEHECLYNLEKIVYTFRQQNEKLFLESVFRFDLYIERKIIHRRFVDPKIFNNLNKTSEHFFFYGDKVVFKGFATHSNFKFFTSENEAKEAMERTSTNTHILKIEDKSTIQWIQSKGPIESLQTFFLTRTLESAALLDEKIIIISGEPGQGKSTIIKKMFLKLRAEYWIFAIPLQHANFDYIDDNVTIDCIAKFILSISNTSENDILHILSFCLCHKTNLPIYLMFDGFDQIKNLESRNKFVKMINRLKHFENVNILITTQNYLASKLENEISVPASYFDSRDLNVEIIDYLSKFWESCPQIFEYTNTHKFQSSASFLLSAAGDIFGEKISTFLAIPLHVRILAELMQPTSINSSLHTLSDIRVPYQKLIEKRYEIYFKRNNFPDNDILKEFAVYGIFEKLYNLAIKQLIDADLNFFDHQYIEELNKVGLIQSYYNNANFSFLHDSLRDYFIAHFINLWLEKKLNNSMWNINYFITHILIGQQYKEIRMFINCHLQTCKVSSTILTTCKNTVSVLTEDDEYFSDNGNTFFHIAVEESLDFILKLLMDITAESEFIKLLCKRNSDLKTALFLTIVRISENHVESEILKVFLQRVSLLPTESIKVILLSAFFTYHTTEEHIEIFLLYSSPYHNILNILQKIKLSLRQKDSLLEAWKNNEFEEFRKILKQESDPLTRRYLAQITNVFKETGLHRTNHTQMIQLLLEYGVNINAQDHHGMTPLARAIKDNKGIDIFNRLIEKGADITVSDNFKNSPFLHAIKQGNLDILHYFMKSGKIDVTHSNIFSLTYLMAACTTENDGVVRWLLDKGAEINLVDSSNLSALFHCVKANRSNLIKFLVKKGANINIQDCYGTTPLLYSIKKSNWGMVNSLIDNGADVSIRNNYGQYPIKVLIEKQKPRIIDKILTLKLLDLNDLKSILDKTEMEYLCKYVFKENILLE